MPEKDSWCSVGDLKNISINIRERYLNRSTGLWVVDQYDKLKRDFRYWENDLNVINRINGHSLKFLEHVHRLWECTSIYFQAPAEREKDPISFFL
jgi:hypothetical protein